MISRLNLEKAVLKLMQNLMSKLQFNDFLFSRKAISSCMWWHSHQCLCSVLGSFYLFRLMFLVYLSPGLHTLFFSTCLILWRLFLGDSSWIVHDTVWCFQWRWMTSSYLLCCLDDVQCNVYNGIKRFQLSKSWPTNCEVTFVWFIINITKTTKWLFINS